MPNHANLALKACRDGVFRLKRRVNSWQIWAIRQQIWVIRRSAVLRAISGRQ